MEKPTFYKAVSNINIVFSAFFFFKKKTNLHIFFFTLDGILVRKEIISANLTKLYYPMILGHEMVCNYKMLVCAHEAKIPLKQRNVYLN